MCINSYNDRIQHKHCSEKDIIYFFIWTCFFFWSCIKFGSCFSTWLVSVLMIIKQHSWFLSLSKCILLDHHLDINAFIYSVHNWICIYWTVQFLWGEILYPIQKTYSCAWWINVKKNVKLSLLSTGKRENWLPWLLKSFSTN